MKFKKVYIEITNRCNFSCKFCFSSSRAASYMPVESFRTICRKVKPFTDYLYLHVLGEPLMHPEFEKILIVAREEGLQVNLTTNGSLLALRKDVLTRYPVRQINFSLHDAQENIRPAEWDNYLSAILAFSRQIAPVTYVNLRLWNDGVPAIESFNNMFLDRIYAEFGVDKHALGRDRKNSGVKLGEHVFLQLAPRFEWPDGENVRHDTDKNCYALRDHFAVLVDGTLVPCCLDADGHIALGNMFSDELPNVLNSKRACKIKVGFANGKITEDFCKSCGFALR